MITAILLGTMIGALMSKILGPAPWDVIIWILLLSSISLCLGF